MGLELSGVKLIAEGAAAFFSDVDNAAKVLQQFGLSAQESAQQASSAFDKIIARTNELVETTNLTTQQALAQAIQEVGQSAQDAASPVEQLGDAEAQAAEQAKIYAAALQQVGTQLVVLGTAGTTAAIGMATTASRIEELEVILEVTRQNAIGLATAEGELTRAAALNSEAVQAQVQGIRDLHLTGIVANATVANMIRYNLDWTKATELAALAQNSAVFAMQDSSQALEGLMRGITTLQTRQLRTYGIMINLKAAYADYAAANNLTTASLTENQKQQAALNAVLAQAPAVAGAYTAAMGTASKQLRSLKTDTINLAEAYGEHLVPVLDLGVGAFRSVLKGLTDLPDPMQAFAVSAGAAASTMALVTGSVIKLLPRLTDLKNAFVALSVSSKALLGLGGIASILIGLAVAANAVDKAHREEAQAIFESSENYNNYIRRVEEAGVASYALSESLYKVAKGAQEAGEAVDAIALQQAEKETTELVKEIIRMTDEWERNSQGMEMTVTRSEFLEERLKELVGRMSDLQLETGISRTEMIVLAQSMGLTLREANDLVTVVDDLISKEKMLREFLRAAEYGREPWQEITQEAAKYEDVLRENLNWVDILDQRERARFENRKQQAQEEREFTAAITDAVEDSAWKQIEAWDARTQAFEELDRDYADKAGDLWRDYQDALADVDQDIAEFHAGTLDELLDLDREYGQKRSDVHRDYLQAIEDAERDLAQDLQDLATDRIQKLEDLEREYAQDREDIMRDLARDLQDIERDHLDTMRDLEEDYYADLAALADEYGRKLASITEKYAQERQSIEEKYSLEPPEPDYDAQREQLQDLLRDLIAAYEAGDIDGYFYRQRRKTIEAQLEALKQEELAALEERKQEELAELEKWLAEEEAAREEAYQKARDEEERRFQERKADREEEARQRLDDLQRQNQQERDEIERDYQRRLEELRLQHQREREEIDRNNQQRLEDIDTQYGRERALILEKLEDQRADAQEKYQEGLEDLNQWFDDQKDTINDRYEEQRAEIERNLQLAVLKASEEFGKMPEAFRPVWDELIRQGKEQAANFVDGIIDEFQRLFDFFQIHSPSKLMDQFAQDVVSPLESVWGNFSASDLLGDALGATSMQANIDAALGRLDLSTVLPAQRAIVPGGMGATTSSTVNNNLSVTAQYQKYQSESSLRQDMALLSMMMNAVPR